MIVFQDAVHHSCFVSGVQSHLKAAYSTCLILHSKPKFLDSTFSSDKNIIDATESSQPAWAGHVYLWPVHVHASLPISRVQFFWALIVFLYTYIQQVCFWTFPSLGPTAKLRGMQGAAPMRRGPRGPPDDLGSPSLMSVFQRRVFLVDSFLGFRESLGFKVCFRV